VVLLVARANRKLAQKLFEVADRGGQGTMTLALGKIRQLGEFPEDAVRRVVEVVWVPLVICCYPMREPAEIKTF
jgi:hypothetical protein